MILFTTGILRAQDIKGIVTDTNKVSIPNANIVLRAGDNNILSFTSSDTKGAYLISLKNVTKTNGTLFVEVSCIGYKSKVQKVDENNGNINFILSTDNNQLHDVFVKSHRDKVRLRGDTTSYKASDFSSQQDRVIGDVIKKIPGIEMDANGKIKYNGRAISNFYLDGDNLLDDKYNIATKTIPNGAVDLVQIMENHQPIKMLQHKVNSNDVAINLTFKKDAKIGIVGQETIGAGIPGKYYGDLNAMAFKSKFKAINFLKGNNTGEDVNSDLISHNLNDYQNRIDNFPPAELLSLGTASNPDLPVNRYLFNKSGLISLNDLVHLQDEVTLRTNIYYYRDNQRQDYQKFSKTYLPNDTITYYEDQHKKTNPQNVHSEITLNANKANYYFNDVLLTEYIYNDNKSYLSSTTGNINQQLSDNTLYLSNEFNGMKSVNNKIFEFYSYLSYHKEPQSLNIDTSLNTLINNNGLPYNQIFQNLNIPTFFVNNNLSLKIPAHLVTQGYKLGISSQQQQLNSELGTTSINGSYNSKLDSSQNDLKWSRNKFYGEAKYDLLGSQFKGTITFPVFLQKIDYSSGIYQLQKEKSGIYFAPDANVKYLFSTENYLSFSYSTKKNFGSIEDIYPSYILLNYRSLQANANNLTDQTIQNSQLGLSLKQSIILLYFNVFVAYTHVSSNTIVSSIITNTGQKTITIPFPNNTNSYSITGFLSKYLFNLHTNVSISNSFQISNSNEINNSNFLSYRNYNNDFIFNMEANPGKTINVSYNFNLLNTWSSSADAASTKFFLLKQAAAVFINPTQIISFKVSADNYLSEQIQSNTKNYTFFDGTCRFKINKIKSDVELGAYNLLNTKTFSGVYLTNNNYVSTTYQIPGRYVMIKYQFNL